MAEQTNLAWQYGVQFADGSVRAQWTGGTQEARAQRELMTLLLSFPGDRMRLVRRRRDADGGRSEWVVAPEQHPPGQHLWITDPSTVGMRSAPMVTCVCGEVGWRIAA
jgi:hypothetical protein